MYYLRKTISFNEDSIHNLQNKSSGVSVTKSKALYRIQVCQNGKIGRVSLSNQHNSDTITRHSPRR